MDLTCPYCGAKARLRDSSIVYHGRSYGKIYVCDNYPECDAYVGAHANGKPKGTLANQSLRDLRVGCHRMLDPLWQQGIISRDVAYLTVQKIMGLPPEKAHIGMFNEDQCLKLMAGLEEMKFA